VTLGKLTADATGKAIGSLTIPSTTATGAHSLELKGTGATGGTRAVSVSLTVADATTTTLGTGTGTSTSDSSSSGTGSSPSGSLSRTGAESLRLLRFGGLLVFAGFVLVLAGRRRARRR